MALSNHDDYICQVYYLHVGQPTLLHHTFNSELQPPLHLPNPKSRIGCLRLLKAFAKVTHGASLPVWRNGRRTGLKILGL